MRNEGSKCQKKQLKVVASGKEGSVMGLLTIIFHGNSCRTTWLWKPWQCTTLILKIKKSFEWKKSTPKVHPSSLANHSPSPSLAPSLYQLSKNENASGLYPEPLFFSYQTLSLMISSWAEAPNSTNDPKFVFLALLYLLLQTHISNYQWDTFSRMEIATSNLSNLY